MEEIAQRDAGIRETLQRYIDEGKSYKTISHVLKNNYPSIARGLSTRSVRRFCAQNQISKKKAPQLDAVIAQSVLEVRI